MLSRTDSSLGTLDRLKPEGELRERAALLNQPVKLTPDPLVAARVLESFVVGPPFATPARNAAVGEVISLPGPLAADMVAIGRAQRV